MAQRRYYKRKRMEDSLADKIKKAVTGLYYVSETDAEIIPFVGRQAEAVTQNALLSQINSEDQSREVEERNFGEFFAPLIEIQDWFGEEETEAARKFSALKELLEGNLRDLKVFKVGNIELDVYAVGLDADGVLTGIKTQAVET